jgi:hypothetical protein
VHNALSPNNSLSAIKPETTVRDLLSKKDDKHIMEQIIKDFGHFYIITNLINY